MDNRITEINYEPNQMPKQANCFLKRKHYILTALGVKHQVPIRNESLDEAIYRFLCESGLSFTETDVTNVKQVFQNRHTAFKTTT